MNVWKSYMCQVKLRKKQQRDNPIEALYSIMSNFNLRISHLQVVSNPRHQTCALTILDLVHTGTCKREWAKPHMDPWYTTPCTYACSVESFPGMNLCLLNANSSELDAQKWLCKMERRKWASLFCCWDQGQVHYLLKSTPVGVLTWDRDSCMPLVIVVLSPSRWRLFMVVLCWGFWLISSWDDVENLKFAWASCLSLVFASFPANSPSPTCLNTPHPAHHSFVLYPSLLSVEG